MNRLSFSRICNPTAGSISICNALKTCFVSDYKSLYSMRVDYKSTRT